VGVFDIAIAHRGLHSKTVSENSMKAFELAVEKGYNIELDVHRLTDDKIIVFHDDNVKRMIPTKDIKITELSSKDIDGEEYLLPDGQHIPYFEDILKMVDGKVNIVCEIKNLSFTDFRLEKIVIEMIKDKPWIVMEAFNPFSVGYFKKHAPSIVRGQLSTNIVLKFIPHGFLNWNRILSSLNFTKPNFVAYNIMDLPIKTLNYQCKKRNMKLVAWTIRTQEDYDKAKEIGVDAVIFENIRPELSYHPTNQL